MIDPWQFVQDIDFKAFAKNPNRYKYAARVATGLRQYVLTEDEICGESLLDSFIGLMSAVLALTLGEEDDDPRVFDLLSESGEREWFDLLKKNAA